MQPWSCPSLLSHFRPVYLADPLHNPTCCSMVQEEGNPATQFHMRAAGSMWADPGRTSYHHAARQQGILSYPAQPPVGRLGSRAAAVLQAAADGPSQAPDCQAGPAAPLAEQACPRLSTSGVASVSVLTARIITILAPADTAARTRRLKATSIRIEAWCFWLNPTLGTHHMQAAVHHQGHHMPWHSLQMLLLQKCSKSVPACGHSPQDIG